jgi:DNA-binding FadR family transcriptional regulator
MQVEKDRRPVTTQLVQQIRRLMAETGLKPGDRVPPQRELAQRLGASRPTVREAVLQLEGMGLIRIEPARPKASTARRPISPAGPSSSASRR